MKRIKLEEDGFRLVVEEMGAGTGKVWGLGWEQLDGFNAGFVDAFVGDNPRPSEPLESLAFRILKKLKAKRDAHGRFFFETKQETQLALAAVRTAVESNGKPWPEWALKAKDAGWKPPHGWQP